MDRDSQGGESCPYCDIAAGLEPWPVIFEDNIVIAFAPEPDKTLGKFHFVLMPKEHYQTFFEVPPEILSHLEEILRIMGAMLKENFGFEDMDLLRFSNPDAIDSLLFRKHNPPVHFHYHIIPRRRADDMFFFPKERYIHSDYKGHYEKFETAMSDYLKKLYEKNMKQIEVPDKFEFILNRTSGSVERIDIPIPINADEEILLMDLLDEVLDPRGLELTDILIFSEDGKPLMDSDLFYPLMMILQLYGSTLIIKERASKKEAVDVV